MSISDKLKQLSPRTLVALLALILVLLYFSLRPRGVDPARAQRWYCDLDTGERVAFDPPGGASPARLPSGHDGVLAHVFACGNECTGETFIGYVERSDHAPVEANPDRPFNPDNARIIAPPPVAGVTPKWTPAGEPAASEIMLMPQKRCGQVYRECFP